MRRWEAEISLMRNICCKRLHILNYHRLRRYIISALYYLGNARVCYRPRSWTQNINFIHPTDIADDGNATMHSIGLLSSSASSQHMGFVFYVIYPWDIYNTHLHSYATTGRKRRLEGGHDGITIIVALILQDQWLLAHNKRGRSLVYRGGGTGQPSNCELPVTKMYTRKRRRLFDFI